MSNEASSSKTWADMLNINSSSSDDENMVEGSDLEISSDLENADLPIDENENEEKYGENCECFNFDNGQEIISYMISCLESNDHKFHINCFIDNLSRCFNFSMVNFNETDSIYRLILCDYFYRLRHEVLFKFICLSLNLPLDKSDRKFSDFGIDSVRTPDFIDTIVDEGTGDEIMVIIEVTASSSFDKAALSKGLEEAGFESKYKKEMEMLDTINRKYIYVPFIFDMSNVGNYEYLKSFKLLERYYKQNSSYQAKLRVLKESLCILTIQVSKFLSTPATMLFNKVDPIKKDHDDLSFFFTTTRKMMNPPIRYMEYCISSPVYNKITNNWIRIKDIVRRSDKGCKVVLYIDIKTHKIHCDESMSVLFPVEYSKIIDDNDKTQLFNYLYIKQSNKFIKATNSDSGVRYIERTSTKPEQKLELVPIYQNHDLRQFTDLKQFDKQKYINIIDVYFSTNYVSLDFDENYEDTLIKKVCETDQKCSNIDDYTTTSKTSNLMYLNEISKIDIESDFKLLAEKQIGYNKETEEQPIKVIKNKSPFLLPMADIVKDSYCKLTEKNVVFYKAVLDQISMSDPYTSIILDHVIDDSFEFIKDQNMPSQNYLNAKRRAAEVSMEITKLSKDFFRSNGGKMIEPISKTKQEPFRSRFQELSGRYKVHSKSLQEVKVMEGLSNEIQFIRLPTKNKNSILGNKFKLEMLHYKDKKAQSVMTGIGYREGIHNDFQKDKVIYDNITSHLTEYAGDNPNLFFEHFETEDSKLLKELKDCAVSEYLELINDVKNSFLGHAAALVSNLSHSLLFYSQLPFNSDYIRVDNLGYKNVLLIVRGGKKIFKSKASKMFRLIFPISEAVLPWYKTGHGADSSTKIIEIEDNFYAISPWAQMHESILNDSISFYTRVVSFTILNLNPRIKFKFQFPKISLNVILSFHNRRQTEVILANLRYILLATLGDFTGIMDIFDEFLGFNYDCLQSYIRGCILYNYPYYFNTLLKLKDIKKKDQIFKDFVRMNPQNLFSGSPISNEEDLALMIYSTFLMTKAPYQRVVERARNLKGILGIHDYFVQNFGEKPRILDLYEKTKVTINEDEDFANYTDRLFSNDFNFDPKYCSQLGVFIDNYFLNMNLKDDIFNSWTGILNKSWDELATSTGLRGKFDDLSTFWGQKGYFVVYKELVDNKSYLNDVFKLIDTSLDVDSKRKLLRDLNVIYKAKITEIKEYLIFHAVDKVQWRGGREIYVMDIETKTVQQPIEKFMGYLCQKLDNELISIPSDKRAQVIHHSIFERDLPLQDTLTWYLTLDCSKWAPKSNFLKFIPMILNMTCLPSSFKTHFLNYTQKLYKKRIYFNVAEVEVLKNNPVYSKIVSDYLCFDEVLKGYYLEMPYSWVMGIFNYTSSFMHAVNQKYCSYIIFKTSIMTYGEETKLVMFAHSDDSGGRLTGQNYKLIKRAIFHYEVQLKMCNHLLSKKKSVISRFYFEILSVIYLFKKLLALLPKFLGGLRFTPTDKGIAQDMLQSYSKSIEVMVSGASFNVAYLVMKFYSYMIYRFYFHKKKITESNFKSPVQYLGLPDAHPLMVLLCGADSDMVRLIGTGNEESLINQHAFITGLVQTIEDEGPIKPIKFNISVRGMRKGFEESISKFSSILKSWSISNVNFHSTPFNLFSFLSKLTDPGFVGSLVNESTTRRLSRAYHFRKGNVIPTVLGDINLETFMDCLKILNEIENKGNQEDKPEFLKGDLTIFLKEGLENNRNSSLKQIWLFKELMSSPLKVMKYMNNLSIEGRQIVESKRTLKPTHLELIKSSRTFANKFDPAQMVSYIKEPEFSWALPDIRNIIHSKSEVISLCEDLGFNIEEINPSTLLKLCRTYSSKHTKSIYLYSQVPGEIRQIKTYTSFLTFLSTNSYRDREITGLILKLKSNLTDPGYVNINMDEDVYYINNMISIFLTLIKVCDVEFFISLRTKKIDLLGWEGGSMLALIDHINGLNKNAPDSIFYSLQINYLNSILKGFTSISSELLKECAFYLFTKSQKSKGNWYGKGEILIHIKREIYLFEIYNDYVTKLSTNVKGKIPKLSVSYILDVLSKSNIKIRNNEMKHSVSLKTEYVFGVDYNGDYNIGSKREIYKAIEVTYHPVLKTILDTFSSCSLKLLFGNTFLLISNDETMNLKWKLHTLPLLNSEMMNILSSMLYKEDFEIKLEVMGLNDFEEFLLTEVMVEYGVETYINPNDFFDNYQASKIYQVFKETKEKGYSELPKKLETSLIPAPLGSLLRILIDYSNNTGEDIIKVTNKLTPEIMTVRSQYPEHVSVVLSETLVKCHKSIYDNNELMEIKNTYMELSKIINTEQLNKNIIKILTHWGYGALVNTIEEYSLSQDGRNFKYFALKKWSQMTSSVTSNLFLDFHKIITKTMYNNRLLYNDLDFVIPEIRNPKGIERVIYNQCLFISNSLYGSNIIFYCIDIYHLNFINTLHAFLKEDDFVNELNKEANSNYILCSLNYSFQNRDMVIAFYNTLMVTFIQCNKQSEKLDFLSKVQRFSASSPQPTVILKNLVDPDIFKVKTAGVHYNYFLNDSIISHLKRSVKIEANNCTYRISQEIKSPSKKQVDPNILPVNHVYSDEFFDHENFEEIECTIDVGDCEWEDIEEYFDEIKNKFIKPRTKKMDLKTPTVQCLLTWIIDPFCSFKSGFVKNYRQCGENIIVVSTSFDRSFLKFPNSHFRIVNFSRLLKTDCPDMLLSISSSKFLNLEFWDRLLGGRVLSLSKDLIDILKPQNILLEGGIPGSIKDTGLKADEKFLASFDKNDSDNVEIENEKELRKEEEEIVYKEKVIESIENAHKKGIISKRLKWRLIDKYNNQNLIKYNSLENLFLNCMNEINLNKINQEIKEGSLEGIDKKSYVKIFLAPEHFGLSHSSNRPDPKSIKNKKVKAELESLSNGFVALIGSGALTVSRFYEKTLKSNFKLWSNMVKGSNYKRENKKFLLILFSSIFNSSKVVDDDTENDRWQSFANLITNYIADDGPEEDEEDEIFELDVNISSTARLLYKAVGF